MKFLSTEIFTKFIDTEINSESSTLRRKEIILMILKKEVILKDAHRGLIHAEIIADLCENTYGITYIEGRARAKEKTKLERLNYKDLEELYLCSCKD